MNSSFRWIRVVLAAAVVGTGLVATQGVATDRVRCETWRLSPDGPSQPLHAYRTRCGWSASRFDAALRAAGTPAARRAAVALQSGFTVGEWAAAARSGGMPATTGLRILREHGVSAPVAALAWDLSPNLTPRAAARAMRVAGFPAQSVAVALRIALPDVDEADASRLAGLPRAAAVETSAAAALRGLTYPRTARPPAAATGVLTLPGLADVPLSRRATARPAPVPCPPSTPALLSGTLDAWDANATPVAAALAATLRDQCGFDEGTIATWLFRVLQLRRQDAVPQVLMATYGEVAPVLRGMHALCASPEQAARAALELGVAVPELITALKRAPYADRTAPIPPEEERASAICEPDDTPDPAKPVTLRRPPIALDYGLTLEQAVAVLLRAKHPADALARSLASLAPKGDELSVVARALYGAGRPLGQAAVSTTCGANDVTPACQNPTLPGAPADPERLAAFTATAIYNTLPDHPGDVVADVMRVAAAMSREKLFDPKHVAAALRDGHRPGPEHPFSAGARALPGLGAATAKAPELVRALYAEGRGYPLHVILDVVPAVLPGVAGTARLAEAVWRSRIGGSAVDDTIAAATALRLKGLTLADAAALLRRELEFDATTTVIALRYAYRDVTNDKPIPLAAALLDADYSAFDVVGALGARGERLDRKGSFQLGPVELIDTLLLSAEPGRPPLLRVADVLAPLVLRSASYGEDNPFRATLQALHTRFGATEVLSALKQAFTVSALSNAQVRAAAALAGLPTTVVPRTLDLLKAMHEAGYLPAELGPAIRLVEKVKDEKFIGAYLFSLGLPLFDPDAKDTTKRDDVLSGLYAAAITDTCENARYNLALDPAKVVPTTSLPSDAAARAAAVEERREALKDNLRLDTASPTAADEEVAANNERARFAAATASVAAAQETLSRKQMVAQPCIGPLAVELSPQVEKPIPCEFVLEMDRMAAIFLALTELGKQSKDTQLRQILDGGAATPIGQADLSPVKILIALRQAFPEMLGQPSGVLFLLKAQHLGRVSDQAGQFITTLKLVFNRGINPIDALMGLPLPEIVREVLAENLANGSGDALVTTLEQLRPYPFDLTAILQAVADAAPALTTLKGMALGVVASGVVIAATEQHEFGYHRINLLRAAQALLAAGYPASDVAVALRRYAVGIDGAATGTKPFSPYVELPKLLKRVGLSPEEILTSTAPVFEPTDRDAALQTRLVREQETLTRDQAAAGTRYKKTLDELKAALTAYKAAFGGVWPNAQLEKLAGSVNAGQLNTPNDTVLRQLLQFPSSVYVDRAAERTRAKGLLDKIKLKIPSYDLATAASARVFSLIGALQGDAATVVRAGPRLKEIDAQLIVLRERGGQPTPPDLGALRRQPINAAQLLGAGYSTEQVGAALSGFALDPDLIGNRATRRNVVGSLYRAILGKDTPANTCDLGTAGVADLYRKVLRKDGFGEVTDAAQIIRGLVSGLRGGVTPGDAPALVCDLVAAAPAGGLPLPAALPAAGTKSVTELTGHNPLGAGPAGGLARLEQCLRGAALSLPRVPLARVTIRMSDNGLGVGASSQLMPNGVASARINASLALPGLPEPMRLVTDEARAWVPFYGTKPDDLPEVIVNQSRDTPRWAAAYGGRVLPGLRNGLTFVVPDLKALQQLLPSRVPVPQLRYSLQGSFYTGPGNECLSLVNANALQALAVAAPNEHYPAKRKDLVANGEVGPRELPATDARPQEASISLQTYDTDCARYNRNNWQLRYDISATSATDVPGTQLVSVPGAGDYEHFRVRPLVPPALDAAGLPVAGQFVGLLGMLALATPAGTPVTPEMAHQTLSGLPR